VLVAVALPVLALLLPKLSTIDLAYQVRTGELMLRSHRLLDADVLTFTAAGQPWLNQQWGSEVLFALLHRVGGWPLLILTRAVLGGAVVGFVFLACRARGARTKWAALLAMASFGVWLPGGIMRPQLFGLVLFAATVWLVFDRARHPERLWWIPAMVVVWANLHGSFFLAPLVTGLAWLEARHAGEDPAVVRRLAIVAIASVAAATVNPFGLRVWSYAVGIPSNHVVADTIVEWRSPSLRTAPGVAFFLSAAAVALLLVRSRRPIPWTTLVPLGVFFAIGLFAVRGVYWWALISAPVLAGLLPNELPRWLSADHRSPANTAMAGAIALTVILGLPWLRTSGPGASTSLLDHAPPGVTTSLASVLRPGERMFNPQIWGSWFEFRFPSNPVAVDSRIEVFDPSVWDRYDRVSRAAADWRTILDDWGIDVVVASRRQQAALIPVIGTDPDWRLVHQDADGLVFVREGRSP
jgi:hypothetical protein